MRITGGHSTYLKCFGLLVDIFRTVFTTLLLISRKFIQDHRRTAKIPEVFWIPRRYFQDYLHGSTVNFSEIKFRIAGGPSTYLKYFGLLVDIFRTIFTTLLLIRRKFIQDRKRTAKQLEVFCTPSVYFQDRLHKSAVSTVTEIFIFNKNKAHKYWNRKNFRLSSFSRFSCFGMSLTRFDYFCQMSMYV